MRAINRKTTKKCPDCLQDIFVTNFSRHRKTHANGTLHCPHCSNFYSKSEADLKFHIAKKHGANSGEISENSLSCSICDENFNSFYSLQQHKKSKHGTSGKKRPAVDLSMFEHDPKLLEEMESVKHFLFETVDHAKHQIVFNYPLQNQTHNEVNRLLDEVFDQLPCTTKLNFAFGYVLANIDPSLGYRYYYAHNNSNVFTSPIVVNNKSDLEFVKDLCDGEDFFQNAIRGRPDTKWRFHQLTNVTFFATLLRDVPLGCKNTTIPDFLRQNHAILTLTYDYSTKRDIKDNLCVFRALACHICNSEGDLSKWTGVEAKTNELFNSFLQHFPDIEPSRFQGLKENQFLILEQISGVNIVIYAVAYEKKQLIGEIVRRSMGIYETTATLIKHNKHVCYTKDVNKFFHTFRCTNCSTFFKHAGNFRVHQATCSERSRDIYPGSVYNVKQTLFEKLEEYEVTVPKNLRYFKNFAIFDFESYCSTSSSSSSSSSSNEYPNDTENLKWIGKHVPISVSVSSNLIQQPIFICDNDPNRLVKEFVVNLEILSQRSKSMYEVAMKPYIEKLDGMIAAIDSKIGKRQQTKNDVNEEDENDSPDSSLDLNIIDDFIVDPKPRRVGDDFDADLAVPLDINFDDDPIPVLKRLRAIWGRLRCEFVDYISTLPVFGFNSSRYDLNLIKQQLIPFLVSERKTPPEVIKKCNQFVSLKFDGIQFLDILNFLGGCTSLDSFLKAYKTTETKGFFPYEWLVSSEQLNETCLPPIEAFFNKLRGCNPLDSDHKKYEKLLSQGYNQQTALTKLKLKQIPATGEENYLFLQKVWKDGGMKTMKDFLKWYNDKDVVPTCEALKKMMAFYHNISVDVLKLGYTLPNLANRILHKSTNAKFYPFGSKDADLAQKVRQNVVGGPSIVFTRHAKVNETFIRNSSNVCKTVIGVDASQLYPYAMTQPMPTGPYIRWDFDDATNSFKFTKNWTSELERKVLAYIQFDRPQCNIQSVFSHGTQKRIGPYVVDGFCQHCNTVFEINGCYFHCHDCPKSSITGNENEKQRENIEEKRRFDREKEEYIKRKGFSFVKVWECEWWLTVKNNPAIKSFLQNNFPFKARNLTEEQLKTRILGGSMFGIVECDIHVPENLKEEFSRFPPIFKNCMVGRADIGDHMQQIAEEQNLLKKPRRMLISSFSLQKGFLITPLLLFYLEQGLVLTKIHQFIQYEPRKCFEEFVGSVVKARRQGDTNPESSVVAETMKLIGNSSYGYQIMDRCKHTETRYVDEAMTDSLINKKMFSKYDQINEDVFEVTSVKTKTVHKEAIVIGLFILQYAKLRMLEIYYNFFNKYCDINLFEELEMDTDSLYLALGVESIDQLVVEKAKKDTWELIRAFDCDDGNFEADAEKNFFPRECCPEHKKFDNRTPGLFKEEFRGTEMVCLCSKTYCCTNENTEKTKFSSKGLNKRPLENDEEDPVMSKYRRVLQEKANVMSENRGFRTIDDAVYTYEQNKKGLAYFYPKRKVLSDGIHTIPLDI